MLRGNPGTLIVAIATFLFFAGIAWEELANNTAQWVEVMVGVSAAILAISALLALL